eukprot:g9728.t1
MKVNKVVVTLLFLVAAMQQPGGALAVRQPPEAVQQDMFRRLAAITGMDASKLLDKPHFPVAMNGYGHTVAAGLLRLVRNYLRWDSDMLATIVMKDDGWAPMLVLFADNDVDSPYDVIELVDCAVTRVQDRRMCLSKGEESLEFIAPSSRFSSPSPRTPSASPCPPTASREFCSDWTLSSRTVRSAGATWTRACLSL